MQLGEIAGRWLANDPDALPSEREAAAPGRSSWRSASDRLPGRVPPEMKIEIAIQKAAKIQILFISASFL
ncbi:hypothetical protein [Cupriavidus basilensis]|uniref:hypothetical protein n=1 Tax=Cupriavidus basilensis TaxID=68895 RepID=UPI0002ECAF90|nr:hypothetical protein [Cupriavidus basilensis]